MASIPQQPGHLARPPKSGSLTGIPIFSMTSRESDIPLTGSKRVLFSPLITTSHEASGCSTLSLLIFQKLSKRILEVENIEMSKLLPETWGLTLDMTYQCCHKSCRLARGGPVMDILLQIEIYMYNSLIAILTTKFPQHIGDFMEYQKNHYQGMQELWMYHVLGVQLLLPTATSSDEEPQMGVSRLDTLSKSIHGASTLESALLVLSQRQSRWHWLPRQDAAVSQSPGWGLGREPWWLSHPARPQWHSAQMRWVPFDHFLYLRRYASFSTRQSGVM